MTITKRIENLVIIFLQLLCVLALLLAPQIGKDAAIGVLQIYLVINGLRYLLFYFFMARHMVDGRAILYKGGLYLDFGIFAGSISTVPSVYVMLYLIGYFVLKGIYCGLKVMDTRKVVDKKWLHFTFVSGCYLLLALLGVFHLHSETVMAYLLCAELLLSAANRAARVLKKTAIVYIP